MIFFRNFSILWNFYGIFWIFRNYWNYIRPIWIKLVASNWTSNSKWNFFPTLVFCLVDFCWTECRVWVKLLSFDWPLENLTTVFSFLAFWRPEFFSELHIWISVNYLNSCKLILTWIFLNYTIDFLWIAWFFPKLFEFIFWIKRIFVNSIDFLLNYLNFCELIFSELFGFFVSCLSSSELLEFFLNYFELFRIIRIFSRFIWIFCLNYLNFFVSLELHNRNFSSY